MTFLMVQRLALGAFDQTIFGRPIETTAHFTRTLFELFQVAVLQHNIGVVIAGDLAAVRQRNDHWHLLSLHGQIGRQNSRRTG